MKKFLVPLIMILIVSFLLTACGTSTPSATTAPASSPAASKPVSSPSAPASSAAPVSSAAPAPASTTAKPSTTGAAPTYGGVLRIIETRGPSTTLGWYAENGASGGPYTPPVIETLLRVSFENKVTPLLAENYKVADDLKSLTLNIRKGVKFHDGTTMDGAAVKWNLDQMLAAKVSPTSTWTSIDLIDDYTVRINLSSYRNTILNDMASYAGNIISPTAYNSKGKDWIRWNPVGTGAFKFVSFDRDVSVKYTKFPDYWQKGLPYLDGVEYSFITDPMTQSAAFQNKEADSIGDNVGKVMVDLAASIKGSTIVSNPSGVIGLVGDSANADSPFSKLQVRQALDYAIDRDAITKARGFGYSQPIYQFAFPGTPNYIPNLANRSYNPDKAKQLLTEAGYPNGFSITMTCDAGSADKDAMTAVQANLGKVGINAQFVWADNASYLKARTGGWKNGLLAGAIGLDANENNSIARYYIKAAPNYPTMIKGGPLEDMYMASLTSKSYDPALMQKIIQYLYDNALETNLWTISHANLVQSYVHGGNFMSQQSWPGWIPESAWISK
jgi:peptide/nickel transport system substrate-binding protein